MFKWWKVVEVARQSYNHSMRWFSLQFLTVLIWIHNVSTPYTGCSAGSGRRSQHSKNISSRKKDRL